MTHAVALVGAGAPLELEVNAEWLPSAVGAVAEPVTFAISRVSIAECLLAARCGFSHPKKQNDATV